ncbi:hypothetical protein Tco_1411033 [Tanacetum coccineum]
MTNEGRASVAWVNCKVTHPDANIAFVLRPMKDVLPWLRLIVRLPILMRTLHSSYDQWRTCFCGWVNCKVTHPDANIAFVLRPTEGVLPWLGINVVVPETYVIPDYLMVNPQTIGLMVAINKSMNGDVPVAVDLP